MRDIGARYEERAATYLSIAGIETLTRSFYCRGGEIDLIGSDGRHLIFLEVKHRSNKKDGFPSSAVGSMKRRRLSLVA